MELKEPFFLISVPKCGTVLLLNILTTILGTENRGKWIEDCGLNQMVQFENKFYNGHLYHDQSSSRIDGFKKILLYRDPRDYVVSYAYWFNNENRKKTRLDEFFRENNYSIDEIMIDIIRGIRVDDNILLGISEMYDRMHFRWMSENVLPVRYEDLIGSEFGGSDTVQDSTVMKILDWLHIRSGGDILEKIRIGRNPKFVGEKITFRKGGTGSWKLEFKEYHKLLFKKYAPNLTSSLGYEKDENW